MNNKINAITRNPEYVDKTIKISIFVKINRQ